MRLTHAALLNPHFACIDREDHGRYHLLTAPDRGDPHDHAEWGFTSRIVAGGYIEEIFVPAAGNMVAVMTIERETGDVFRVEPHTIHRIVELTAPECLTHVGPDVHTGAPHANSYQFREDGVYTRPVFGGEWVKR